MDFGLVFILLAIFFQGAILGLFCSYVANQKNRSGDAWFFLGFFFSIIALIAISGVPVLKEDDDEESNRETEESK